MFRKATLAAVMLALLAYLLPPAAPALANSAIPDRCFNWPGRRTTERPPDSLARIHVVYIVADSCTDIPWGGVVIGNRALVPFRKFGDAVGVSTQWEPDRNNPATGTAWYIGSSGPVSQHIIRTTIGESTLYVDGAASALDAPARLIGSRTFVPFRALGEAFGGDVWWDQNLQTAVVRVSERYSPNDLGDAGDQVIGPVKQSYYGDVMEEWPVDSGAPDPPQPPGRGGIRPQHGLGLFWTKSYRILNHKTTGEKRIPVGAYADSKRANIVRQACNTNVPSLKVKLGHEGELRVSLEAETTVKATLLESKLKMGLAESRKVSEEQEVVIPMNKKMLLLATDMVIRHELLVEITWTSLQFGGENWISSHVDRRITRVVVWEPRGRSYTYEMDNFDETCRFNKTR